MLPQNLIFFKEKGPQQEILFVILGLFKQPLLRWCQLAAVVKLSTSARIFPIFSDIYENTKSLGWRSLILYVKQNIVRITPENLIKAEKVEKWNIF